MCNACMKNKNGFYYLNKELVCFHLNADKLAGKTRVFVDYSGKMFT